MRLYPPTPTQLRIHLQLLVAWPPCCHRTSVHMGWSDVFLQVDQKDALAVIVGPLSPALPHRNVYRVIHLNCRIILSFISESNNIYQKTKTWFCSKFVDVL